MHGVHYVNCPYCGDYNTFTYYHVDMPTILSACDKDTASKTKSLELRLMVCATCWLGFNSTPLDDSELRDIYDNYLYISPMNGIGRSKYGNMLNLIQRWCLRGDRIVDVGCADGYLLHELEVAGYNRLIGVEPSEQSTVGLLNGLDIFRDYFSPDMFKDNSVDCFILMHVFEHFDDPFSMLDIMKRKLTADGHIILEVPYFSGEHHQHLYYYNLTFLKRLCADKGLNINLIEIDRDTETLRVVLGNTGDNSHVESFEKPVNILDKCLRMNMNYLLKIERINELIRRKKQIIWWGAGSTSVIFLNQIERNSHFPSMMTIVDGDKNKWEKYIPVINQKVYPYTILSNQIVDNMIVASSFSNEIKQTLVQNNISVNDMEVFV